MYKRRFFMNAHKKTCLVSAVCYGLYVLSALMLVLIMFFEMKQIPESGDSLGEGLSRAFLQIFMILFGIAGAVSLVPLLLKIWHIFLPKTAFAVICMIFDLAYAVLFTVWLMNGLQEANGTGTVLAVIGILTAIVSLIANCIAIRTGREEAYYR